MEASRPQIQCRSQGICLAGLPSGIPAPRTVTCPPPGVTPEHCRMWPKNQKIKRMNAPLHSAPMYLRTSPGWSRETVLDVPFQALGTPFLFQGPVSIFGGNEDSCLPQHLSCGPSSCLRTRRSWALQRQLPGGPGAQAETLFFPWCPCQGPLERVDATSQE